MDKLQFNFDEDSLYSPLSPDVIDISSETEETFSVAPGNISQLGEKFRVNPAENNLMSTFVGSSVATLFPNSNVLAGHDDAVRVEGTQIEQDLIELMNDSQDDPVGSPSSFIDSEFEEGNLFPWTENRDAALNTNSYGRPCARVLPTVREDQYEGGILPTPTVTQEPSRELSQANMQSMLMNDPMDYEIHSDVTQSQQPVMRTMQGFNLSPMLFPIPLEGTTQSTRQTPFAVQQPMQLGFPFDTVHSPNVVLIPAQERQGIRLLPTVMPNVAGHCDFCGKCFDQIALETLGQYLVATEYDGETVKERAIRSKAFIHGFEAALFLFKNAGLSHPPRCDGSVVQL